MAEWNNITAIDDKLLSVTRDHFRSVYVSDQYKEKGSESLRINVISSEHKDYVSSMLEIREYQYEFHLYFRRNNTDTRKIVAIRVDKLINILSNAKNEQMWINLLVNKVEYSSDPDNEDQIVALVEATITKETSLADMPDEDS